MRRCICDFLLLLTLYFVPASSKVYGQESTSFPYASMPDQLPGTKALTWEGDLSVRMLDGAHQFVEEKIISAAKSRGKFWKTDTTSAQAYERSIVANRTRFAAILGLEDKSKPLESFDVGLKENHPKPDMMRLSSIGSEQAVAQSDRYEIHNVRWPALHRVFGEGLLVQPKGRMIGTVIVLPDADQTPEQLLGLEPGVDVQSQFARLLAENGYQVLLPVLVSRKLLFAGEEKQQSYREWLYRQAYHMGRHIIGYEVQKVMAAIDWVKQNYKDHKIGVAGYGEGGLIAFYSAAVDTRIDAALVSGYFSPREKVWDEPLYRNVWTLLREFGDAEIASLIAPRGVVVEYTKGPVLVDEIAGHQQRKLTMEGLPYSGYKGKLQQQPYAEVKKEFDRIGSLAGNSGVRRLISGKRGEEVEFGSLSAILPFVQMLGFNGSLKQPAPVSNNLPNKSEDSLRQVRQVKEIEDHVQELVRDSDKRRNRFFLHKVMPEFGVRAWSTKPYHPYYDSKRFIDSSARYRRYFAEQVIGRFEDSLLPPDARTRKLMDKERFTAHEVVMDVYKNVFATGILLVPKDLRSGEKRPVVVCQHGRNDVPRKVVEGNFTIYNDAAAKLVDQGFVVYVPQNPYRGEDRYRWLSRKGNLIGKTLFSFIVAQHDQATRWLASLPFVDKSRIAFYGLSYGGQTAMRVPAILDAYCLSICSGDFGDGARKVTDAHYEGSFVNTIEWEMPYFNMGNTFSYAEMSYLIFPRPFMVERGHHDLVQPPEWVNYEFGKVRFFYDQFGLGGRTEMEQFNGGHTMRGEGTFRFLHKHLNWP